VDPGVDGAGPSCTTATLPLIGQELDAPTIEDILDRTLVEAPWMATRLREVLATLPPESLRLFRSVTGVVIGTLRPSFYAPVTGAIYLDSLYFGSSSGQLGDVDAETSDYRAGFGEALQFHIPARYVLAGTVLGSGKLSLGTRKGSDLLAALLLYHEVTHAVDFFPPDRIAAVDRGTPIDEVRFTGERISDELRVNHPLSSRILRDTAAVRYLGEAPTRSELEVTPEEAGYAFSLDGAVDWYAYATQFEDLAMAHEALWAHFALGLERDVIVLPNQIAPDATCEDVPVAWGQRNRVAAPEVAHRLRRVLHRLVPELALVLKEHLSQMAPPSDVLPGSNACELHFSDGSTSIHGSGTQTVLQGAVAHGRPAIHVHEGRVLALE
jgi:hypothetical protein